MSMVNTPEEWITLDLSLSMNTLIGPSMPVTSLPMITTQHLIGSKLSRKHCPIPLKLPLRLIMAGPMLMAIMIPTSLPPQIINY